MLMWFSKHVLTITGIDWSTLVNNTKNKLGAVACDNYSYSINWPASCFPGAVIPNGITVTAILFS